MKGLLRRSLLPVFGVAMAIAIGYSPLATANSFNQDHIISDPVFDDASTMSAAQIDTFLNTFPNSCISTNSGFSAADPTGYSPSPSQFFYSNTPVSAGTAIYDAAQAYGINPQVILATIQKEEGIVDGSGLYGCSANAIASAAGYGCTDSGTSTPDYSYPSGGLVTPLYYRNGTAVNSVTGSCVNSGPKAGFSEQVIHAVWLLRFSEQRSEGNISWAIIKGNWDNSDDPQSCYSGPMTQGTWQRCPSGGASYYDGYTTIDGTAVHIDDGATAALYWYTPHFHGNQLFFDIFTNWFGSSVILQEVIDRYTVLSNNGASLGSPTDDGYCVDAAHTTCWQGFQQGYIVYNKGSGAWESLGSIRTRWEQLHFQIGEMGFPVGPVICGTIKDGGCYQQYQNGYIVGTGNTGYWESLGDIRTRWSQLSNQDGALGYPTGAVVKLASGGYYQQYQNGYIVGSSATGWWESMNGPIRDRWSALGFQDGRLGYAMSAPDCSQPNSGCLQHFQGGTIYWTSGSGAWQVWGEIGNRYGQLSANSGNLGYPTAAEICGTIKNNGCYQPYRNGFIVGSSATGWWESMNGPIRTKWFQLNYQDGRLGYPTSGQDCTQPNSGCLQHFQGGTIYWTAATDAWQVWGSIGTRYDQLSAANSALGYPTAAEICGTIKNNGCYQPYQNGYIVGTGNTGYWESLGGIRDRWSQLSFQDGPLGYPLSAQLCGLKNSGCYQLYQGGYIVGTSATGYWESYGPIRDKWGALGFENSVLGYPIGAISCTSSACTQTYEHGTITSDSSGTRYTTTS